jgi:NADH-quinone oxidoreductase subunit N
VWLLGQEPTRGAVLAGALTADGLSLFLQAVILAVGIVTVLLTPGYLRANGIERGEHYALLLFSVVGMLGLVSSLELVSMFVALEIMSVALYGLAGIDRARAREPGGGAQVLHHRIVRVGLLPLRRRAGLRRDRSTSIERVARALGVMGRRRCRSRCSEPRCCWWASASRSRASRSTCGLRTSTRGPRPPSRPFMSAGVKAAAFGALLRVFDTGLTSWRATGSRWWRRSRSSRCWWATWPRSRRPA